MFFVRAKTQSPHFQISSGFKGVLEKFRFRDGAVWMLGLTVEIELRF